MNNNLTELVFILDRSGSMSGLEDDTIGGFNSLIEKQKCEEGEALVSTVLFDGHQEVLYDRVPLQKVEKMTRAQYYVRGNTALLDAIGGAIHHIGNVHKYAREDAVHHYHGRHGKREPCIQLCRGEANGGAGAEGIRLGIPVPGRQY